MKCFVQDQHKEVRVQSFKFFFRKKHWSTSLAHLNHIYSVSAALIGPVHVIFGPQLLRFTDIWVPSELPSEATLSVI